MPHENKRSWKLKAAAWLLVLVAVVGFLAWYNLFRTVDLEVQGDGSLRDKFLYASIGTEGLQGLPYWLFVVMPKVFPEYLPGPGGWASLGIPWEQGYALPMGITKKQIGFVRTGINCAFCHVSQVRLSASQGMPDYYPGGPSHQFSAQDYQQFLFNSASDPRFNSSVLMAAISEVTSLSLRERLLYRFLLIPGTRDALLEQKEGFAWQWDDHGRQPHGPGRVDPFNPVKFIQFEIADDGSTGNADIPSIWNQKDRVGQALHWDGLATSFFEVAISSAIGDGALEKYLDVEALRDVEEYAMNLEAPPYPLPIDAELAAAGEGLWESGCAECHATGGARLGQVIPTQEVGTDPERTDAWTQEEVEQWAALAARYRSKYGFEWDLNMQKKSGYVGQLLDGIWLRGPYLHNGSVPTLRALLDPPAQRPQFFYRGYDVLDGEGVGFVSDIAVVEDDVARRGMKLFRFDTGLRGNGNGGHLWGTDLTVEEKDALVEYMKTL